MSRIKQTAAPNVVQNEQTSSRQKSHSASARARANARSRCRQSPDVGEARERANAARRVETKSNLVYVKKANRERERAAREKHRARSPNTAHYSANDSAQKHRSAQTPSESCPIVVTRVTHAASSSSPSRTCRTPFRGRSTTTRRSQLSSMRAAIVRSSFAPWRCCTAREASEHVAKFGWSAIRP